eukprot:4287753-Amphidinium_carterae.1
MGAMATAFGGGGGQCGGRDGNAVWLVEGFGFGRDCSVVVQVRGLVALFMQQLLHARLNIARTGAHLKGFSCYFGGATFGTIL